MIPLKNCISSFSIALGKHCHKHFKPDTFSSPISTSYRNQNFLTSSSPRKCGQTHTTTGAWSWSKLMKILCERQPAIFTQELGLSGQLQLPPHRAWAGSQSAAFPTTSDDDECLTRTHHRPHRSVDKPRQTCQGAAGKLKTLFCFRLTIQPTDDDDDGDPDGWRFTQK